MKHRICLMYVALCVVLVNSLAMAQIPSVSPDFIMTGDENNDSFGFAVGIGSQAIVVTDVHGEDANGANQAFVYDPVNGELLRRLTADVDQQSVMRNADRFMGFDVAVWENLALLAARRSDFPAGDGLVYPGGGFLFDVTTGEQIHHLLGDPCTGCPLEVGGLIGGSAALNESYAVLGAARGEAFVFDVTTGQEIFRFIPENASGELTDVELAGDLLAVGALNEVFVVDLVNESEILRLQVEPGINDLAVEISDDRVFVHTPNLISSFDFEGNLLRRTESSELPGDRRLAYSNGWLVTSSEVFEAESLELVAQLSEAGNPVAIHNDQVILGRRFFDNDQAFSFTVPEPDLSCVVPLVLLALSRLRRKRT